MTADRTPPSRQTATPLAGPGGGRTAETALGDGPAPPPPLISGSGGGAGVAGEGRGMESGLAPAPLEAGGGVGAAPPPLEHVLPLNLARRPFVNSRPVTRAALLIWLAGALLLAANLWLFRGYLASSEETRTGLARSEAATAEARREVAALDGRLAGMKLDQQNREVAFLNRKIDERTFSWSLLFDRIAGVMPDGVRLLQLRPQRSTEKESAAAARAAPLPEAKPKPVELLVSGQAKNDEALLQFVQNLFARAYFDEPNLLHEERGDDNLVKFELTVQYLPDTAETEELPETPPS